MGPLMRFVPFGEAALLIEFEQRIDPEIHQQVVSFTNYLDRRKMEGIQYLIPAYASITVGFDPLLWHFEDLAERLTRFAEKEWIDLDSDMTPPISVPVCYDPDFALDLEDVKQQTGLSAEEIIKLHTQKVYRVYMLGFLPGFAYLGRVDERLRTHRKDNPRLEVPARSVALAGLQTAIYPSQAPGGWQVIGRTPVSVFDMHRSDPFLFEPGMRVQFHSIDRQTFEGMSRGELDKTSEKVMHV